MDYEKLKQEWNKKVKEYSRILNKRLEFVNKSNKKLPNLGFDKISFEVFQLLKKVNQENQIQKFREDFPPISDPFQETGILKELSITNFHYISNEKIAFFADDILYVLDGEKITKISEKIITIGKSSKNNIFAFVYKNKIILKKGFYGEILKEFPYTEPEDEEDGYFWINTETQVIPFNNGEKVLLLNGYAFFVISDDGEKVIEDNKGEKSLITMSNNNKYILLYQNYIGIIIYNDDFQKVGKIGVRQAFPRFLSFSKNDELFFFDSNDFIDGILIGASLKKLSGLYLDNKEDEKEFLYFYFENDINILILTEKKFVVGYGNGYIKAFDFEGKKLWQNYLGSTISGMTISDDEKILWVGSHSGILHKIKLEQGQDSHTIGNGNHKEERRFIFWEEENILKW